MCIRDRFRSDINQGFIDNSKKAVYISSNDLFGLIKARISKNKSIKTIIIDNLKDLKINELVVHQDHGIGKYKGLITMNIESKTTELIKIEYADNNNLYIPITSISLMQRYIGNSGLNTKLADLGTDRWLKIKQRAKKKIQDTAAELLLIQAKRELHKGYRYSFDTISFACHQLGKSTSPSISSYLSNLSINFFPYSIISNAVDFNIFGSSS